nr:MAG TPA: hypothetical protein [Caudoviricetes sp.]
MKLWELFIIHIQRFKSVRVKFAGNRPLSWWIE